MLSFTEENYLKAIYHLSQDSEKPVNTNSIAGMLDTKAASVTDMLKKLAEKKLIDYVPYQGVNLTSEGIKSALKTVRRHRLWEYFLVEKLKYKWDEVHELAEELEHIPSDTLIDRLEAYLDYPKLDPHGDPIPDKEGRIRSRGLVPLSSLKSGQNGVISGVSEHSPSFLQYLDKTKLILGRKIKVDDIMDYDGSMRLSGDAFDTISISRDVAKNILIDV
ncbi:MAG: metal-dependent transcriptional regulator [Mucilaginibacter polytrichastri]|nr:metal-dependent transcriptional regulator [Mucilaginibacter polytrichastri]